MLKEFTLPDLGEGISEAQIVRVMVKDGENIALDQYLMEVETDKAAVEIPSPYAGIATRIHVEAGQTVKVGDVIVTFEGESGGTATKQANAKSSAATSAAAQSAVVQAAPTTPAPPVAAAPDAVPGRSTVAAAPSVRKFAREHGIDLHEVVGSGPGSRITKEDVERHAVGGSPATTAPPALAAAPAPAVPLPGVVGTDKWGPIRREPINQIRKTIAKQMSRSAFTAVHVTHCDEADITELGRMRRQLNELTSSDPKLTVMSFVIRAVCLGLKKYPMFNSSFDEERGEIIYKDYVNMGIAVDTQRGLIVPVIRNADRLSLTGIARALRTIADRIRTNQFGVDDLRGGTFTITNVGALGGTVNTPIINYPEVAILGLGRSRKVPVIRDDKVVPAMVLPVNLSFDHRTTDGANAARFTTDVIGYLETPARFLLE